MSDITQIKLLLKKIPLFSEWDDKLIEEISSTCYIKSYKKGEIIFQENDSYRGAYLLIKGFVKIYKLTEKGHELILQLVKPFNLFADIPLFEGEVYPAYAEAIKNCEIIFIPKEELIKKIKNDPEITFKMLTGYAKKIKILVNQLEEYTLKEIPIRFAHFLLREMKKQHTISSIETFIELKVSKTVIASLLGTTPETLSRVMKKFQKDGIIEIKGKKIFIKNINNLKRLLSAN